MANKFKNPELRKLYDFYVSVSGDTNGPLYTDGLPNRGSSCRCAYWAGYNGLENLIYPPGSQNYAAYCAGVDVAASMTKGK